MKFSLFLISLGTAAGLSGCVTQTPVDRVASVREMNRATTYAPSIEAERRAAIAAQAERERKAAEERNKVKLKPFLPPEKKEKIATVEPKPTPVAVIETTEKTTVIEKPSETPAPPPVEEVKEAKQPDFAVPVPGKPGFVTSPYSPDSGFIDVTGLVPGSQAKDPYTGKIFRVP